MAKSKAKKKSGSDDGISIICRNRKASHEYEILEKLECGLVLQGTEVKSLREGKAILDEAYAKVERGEVWLMNADIPEYTFGNWMNHDPRRPRKLLLHRREIQKFASRASEKSLTLIPLRMYFKNGRAKVEIALGKGKQLHDKREAKKKVEAQREIQRAISDKRR